MKPIVITHYSSTDEDYCRDIKKCKTLRQLRNVVTKYREVAGEAYKEVKAMKEADFVRFRTGILKEEKGKFSREAWVEEFGDILLPRTILIVGLYAVQFKVPFGAMYIRLKELGKLEEKQ